MVDAIDGGPAKNYEAGVDNYTTRVGRARPPSRRDGSGWRVVDGTADGRWGRRGGRRIQC